MVHEYNDPGCRLRSTLSLGCFLARSEVNGPGIRAVVWVQGCPHRCEGCFNPQFLHFSPAQQIPVHELVQGILSLPDIDGVTFSGGEPFSQAGPLAELGARIQKAGLNVVTYSGYHYNQLATGAGPGWKDLLAATDLLIAGPYIHSLACTDSLKGSSNQQIIPISGKVAIPAGEGDICGRTAEFTISADGSITASGFPDSTFLRQLAARCRGM